MQPITENKYLSDKERDNLFALFKKHREDRNSIMFKLMLLTGSRSSEVLKLTPESFNKDGAVTIIATKNSNNRTLPIPKAFVTEILEYIKVNNITKTDRLFPISSRHFRRLWDEWRPNPKKGSHSLRHTTAIMLYLNCHDIKKVQALLGHKQINTTMIYLDFCEGVKQLKSAMKGMWQNKIEE
jgi:integrase